MDKKRSKRNTAKSLILIAIMDIFSLELSRIFLALPIGLLYFLLLLLIYILQLSFLVSINYVLKKISRPKKEFQVNRFITLKLENKITNIYVLGKLFAQCKFLLLNIPIDEVREFDNIKSIDEAAERLDHKLEFHTKSKLNLSPETEFWGHCSNLQAWVEYFYNPSLLHSNLAFPLLRRLTDAGDQIAKNIFKQEILLRFESFNPSTQEYLIKNGYLKYFDKHEKEEIFKLILDEKIWINLGDSYFKTKKINKALYYFLKARNINPINLKILSKIMQIYVKLKDYDKASKIAYEILELSENYL